MASLDGTAPDDQNDEELEVTINPTGIPSSTEVSTNGTIALSSAWPSSSPSSSSSSSSSSSRASSTAVSYAVNSVESDQRWMQRTQAYLADFYGKYYVHALKMYVKARGGEVDGNEVDGKGDAAGDAISNKPNDADAGSASGGAEERDSQEEQVDKDVSTATVFEPFGVEFVPPATDGNQQRQMMSSQYAVYYEDFYRKWYLQKVHEWNLAHPAARQLPPLWQSQLYANMAGSSSSSYGYDATPTATATTTASTPAAKVLHGDSSSGNYVVAGTFNVRTGKFQAVSSEEHFMSKGIPVDRSERQMSHFFDTSQLVSFDDGSEKGKKRKAPKKPKSFWQERKRLKRAEKQRREALKDVE